jgi:acetyl-CoA carboxylase carboxyl transferase subunit alpha
MNVIPLDFEKPILELEKKLEELKRHLHGQAIEMDPEVRRIAAHIEKTKRNIYRNLSAWQRVQIARHPQRPYALDYLRLCFSDFVELRGDRVFGEDKAMPGGLATIGGIRCVVIAHQKGRDTKENIQRNFGSAHPEGYRKALRLMRLGEKFGLPVVALIDTPGAYPGVGAEERHIAEAIAVNLREMMVMRTSIVAVVLGEGGSGGALGIGVADRVLMLQNAYYSVISPEGGAAILWKHRSHAAEAAEAFKLGAVELAGFRLIDEVVPEPAGGAHHDHAGTAANLQRALLRHLQEVTATPLKHLLPQRYRKFRNFGIYSEESAVAVNGSEAASG